MLTNTHIINKQVFEFNCMHSEHAFSMRDKAGAQFQRAIQHSIERICDKLSVAGDDLQIELLEIDLGKISFNNMEEEIIASFEKAFFEKLSDLVLSTNSRSGSVVSKQESSLNILTTFFLSGRLPWYAAGEGKNYITDLLEAVLSTQGEALKKFIYINLHNEKLIDRLIVHYDIINNNRILELMHIDPLVIEKLVDQLSRTMDEIILFANNLEAELSTPGIIFPGFIKEKMHLKDAVSSMRFLLEENSHSNQPRNLNKMALEFIFKLISGGTLFPDNKYFIDRIRSMVLDSFEINSWKPALPRQEIDMNDKDLFGSVNEVISAVQNDPIRSLENNEAENKMTGPLKFYISNAGLVLIAQFLPAFFDVVELLDEGLLSGKAAQVKAVFMLHYLCTGETSSPEYILPLNKVLCGMELEESLPSNVILNEKEKNECNELLEAVISHWQKLGGSSIDGLRESFLNRDGILFFEDNNWKLQVERKGYDVLLDAVPWTFNQVKLKWMKNLIVTEW